MENQEILDLYENVAGLMQEMLAAARNADWDQLTLLESRCSAQVAMIRRGDVPVQALSAVARERKTRLIEKILQDDREIRDLTQPWMTQLSALMNNAGTERKLAKAYGSSAGY